MFDEVFSESLPLADLLVRSAARYPDQVAIAFPDLELSYREVLAQAVEAARGLSALGVRAGDHVGILMPNSPEFIAGYFGIALLGAVIVPINARFRGPELAFVLGHAEVDVLLSTATAGDRMDLRATIAEGLPELADAPADQPLRLDAMPRLRRVVMMQGDAGPGITGAEAFRAAAATVDPADIDRARSFVRGRDVALILYTSGTTAHPKGCLISHEAITRGSVGRAAETVPWGRPHDRQAVWCALPLFHVAAMQTLLATLAMGAAFVTDVFLDGSRALASIERYRVTSIWPWFIAPMNALLNAEDFDPARLASVTSVLLVGPPSELRRVQRLLPQADLINGGGMTEATGYYAMSSRSDTPEQRATTCGRMVAGAEGRVVDPDTGLEVPRGELGELQVRGYSIMLGYYRDPERTAEAVIDGGWLRTGDLFRMLDSGHLVYEGRLKDMLKVGGENVPAVEVEALLCSHPDVLIAEVVSRHDPRLDEVPVAFVELAPGAVVTEAELIEYCRTRAARFKVPRAVYFKRGDEWPMSATKVNKVALRQEVRDMAELPG